VWTLGPEPCLEFTGAGVRAQEWAKVSTERINYELLDHLLLKKYNIQETPVGTEMENITS
jgi:hypothetical protein